MDFTREPIIETILSSKEGHKLLVKNSKHGSQEEYLVNALEIVSFGPALFFRSLEHPKSFLLPISDYEVAEVKEARMVLKNVSSDKPIKIGDGKDNKPSNANKEPEKKESKKGSKKRHNKKRKAAAEGKKESSEVLEEDLETSEKGKKATEEPKESKKALPEGGDSNDGTKVSSSVKPVVPIIFPKPPKIIGKTVFNKQDEEVPKRDLFSDEIDSHPPTELDDIPPEPSDSSLEELEEEEGKKEDQEAS